MADNKDRTMFLLAGLSAILSFVGIVLCWSMIEEQDHMWGLATLWGTASFVMTLVIQDHRQ